MRTCSQCQLYLYTPRPAPGLCPRLSFRAGPVGYPQQWTMWTPPRLAHCPISFIVFTSHGDVSVWGIDPPHGGPGGGACMTGPMESHHPPRGREGVQIGESGHALLGRVTHGRASVQLGDTSPLSPSGWCESGCILSWLGWGNIPNQKVDFMLT